MKSYFAQVRRRYAALHLHLRPRTMPVTRIGRRPRLTALLSTIAAVSGLNFARPNAEVCEDAALEDFDVPKNCLHKLVPALARCHPFIRHPGSRSSSLRRSQASAVYPARRRNIHGRRRVGREPRGSLQSDALVCPPEHSGQSDKRAYLAHEEMESHAMCLR
ncbi:hypothetical protein PsYK624_059130 [Phanerochaete sordida]|uniref:Uncharacterized protein n=1 Tax=Phanerochaete sordida TaxID=48140 RepID=A0A9P3G9A5_9APHY|nr:hypothetical protein PsYK624_059130 [Phanerochaete sordida]